MPYLKLEVGELRTNTYLYYSTPSRRCLIIDPGAEAKNIINQIEREKLNPLAVILTHAHADHLGAAAELLAYFHIPLWLHEAEEKFMHSQANHEIAAMFDVSLPTEAGRLLKDGEIIDTDGLLLKVIHCPGHTPGSILLQSNALLFTGDTLFQGDVGRTDLPGGNEEQLLDSLAKIRQLPPSSLILPGHGETSNLQLEMQTNPYL